ncbi:hypothetical protein SAMN05444359_11669 [Neolewinella agarilytica]|uniref:Uncharacterized protein n=1 Tax=Neolewinella agarilytica TaxID=478744 RepID=A0A1H9J390_9BACT|nr:hypothetical protein SAMN05444359_11669 [Neolewinella agarilytica]
MASGQTERLEETSPHRRWQQRSSLLSGKYGLRPNGEGLRETLRVSGGNLALPINGVGVTATFIGFIL